MAAWFSGWRDSPLDSIFLLKLFFLQKYTYFPSWSPNCPEAVWELGSSGWLSDRLSPLTLAAALCWDTSSQIIQRRGWLGTPSWASMIPSLSILHSLSVPSYASTAPNTVIYPFGHIIQLLLLWSSKVLCCILCCRLLLRNNNISVKQEFPLLFCFSALYLNRRTMGSFTIGVMEKKKRGKKVWCVSRNIELSLGAVSTTHAFKTDWNIPLDPSYHSSRQTLINNPY